MAKKSHHGNKRFFLFVVACHVVSLRLFVSWLAFFLLSVCIHSRGEGVSNKLIPRRVARRRIMEHLQQLADHVPLDPTAVAAISEGRVVARWYHAHPHRVELVLTGTGQVVGSWETQVAPPTPQLAQPLPHSSEEELRAETKLNSTEELAKNPVIVSIARHLALRSMSTSVLQALVCSDNDSVDKDVVRLAIRTYTTNVPGAKAVVDLSPQLLAVVHPRFYSASAEKKCAANRVAKMLQRHGLPFDIWTEWVDKEVYLDLHSSGGIMSGMATEVPSTQAQSASLLSTGEDIMDVNVGDGGDAASIRSKKRRRIERLKDIDNVDLDGGGDLCAAPNAEVPPLPAEDDVERVMTNCDLRRSATQAAPPMLRVRRSPADIQEFRRVTLQLCQWGSVVEDRLSLHERVCSELKHVLEEAGSSSESGVGTSLLAKEIHQWVTPQISKRCSLISLLRRMRLEASLRIREDDDATFFELLLEHYKLTPAN